MALFEGRAVYENTYGYLKILVDKVCFSSDTDLSPLDLDFDPEPTNRTFPTSLTTYWLHFNV